MAKNDTGYVALDEAEFKQLARCVDTIGTPGFPEEICRFCVDVSDSETVFLSAFFDDQIPVSLYANHTEESDKAALDLYLDVAYVLDPFFLLFRDKQGDQVVRLQQIAPDNFKRSQYYQKFYKAIRLRDEIGLMMHIADDAALFFSFGVQTKGRRTDPTGLKIALPLIASLVRRHWTVLSPERTDGSGRLAAHLEAAFEAFGASVLSPREAEISRMILRGHSSKSIARTFDNSPETIKVHRKRIYTKLGVMSQGELLSLFLTSLSQMPPTKAGDPLLFLNS
ncbi:Transcriptional regulatory protein TdiR [Ruegeria denitrificans]|uniref:Transcriptional regulatory protein TdiR n=1 Tax=Ruegeria denitrificans TaxID=1715692 RepID=A0A0P1IFI7_9RHOB|nr:helix-turn-helix transcriptional regulator [Ruegeria denitrificans]CUK10179.1 Transcriptional regulatory protein TdiR [Ruegeria denitrificans]